MAEDSGSREQAGSEEKTFQMIREMIDKLPRGSVDRVTVLKGGGIDVTSLAEIMSSQESIDLSQLDKDDVVWWQTESGGKYYHIIRTPYRAGPTANIIQVGEGPLKSIRSGTKEMPVENVTVQGASYGGSLRLYYINKDVPVEILRNSKDLIKNPILRTTPVKEMGIIKASQYKNP